MSLFWCLLVTLVAKGFSQCGVSKGSTTVQEQFPWHVSIDYYTGQYRHICSGVIVSLIHVITAAHCLDFGDNVESNLQNLRVSQEGPSSQAKSTYRINSVQFMPGWNRSTFENNIALLQLTTTVDVDSGRFGYICIGPNIFLDLKTVNITGWLQHETLQVQTAVLPLSFTCSLSMLRYRALHDSEFCLFQTNILDIIESGSPLQTFINNQYYLVGIASWSPICHYQEGIVIFTNLVNQANWIISQIEPSRKFP